MAKVEFETSDKVCLGNLYLCHVLAFVNHTKIVDWFGAEVDPDEYLMRYLEWEVQIDEVACIGFRCAIVAQYKEQRMDLLYSTFDELFEFLLTYESPRIKAWVNQFPHTIPLVKVS